VLVDLFMGLEECGEEIIAHPGVLFDHLPELKPAVFDGEAPDLAAVRKSRKYQSKSLFGRGVLEICQEADLVFIALHGLNGEDGRVQAAFDMMGIRYTGSGYLGAAMAMDKTVTKQMVRPQGVKTPDWSSYRGVTREDIPGIAAKTKAPCVIKTPTGGSTLGVYIVKDQKDVEPSLEKVLQFSDDILVEQYIEGREFTCGVLLGKALPNIEIAPKQGGYDYNNKYVAGATDEICPGRCSDAVREKIADMSVKVHETLGLRTYSRSDFMVTADDEVYFLEVNTLPGMTPTSLVPQEAAKVGISYADLCQMIVDDAMKED
jgi:D-alanine-D-alanine ligase